MKDISKIIICVLLFLGSCGTPDFPEIERAGRFSANELKVRLNNSLSKNNTDSIIILSKMLLDVESDVTYMEQLMIYLRKINRIDLALEPVTYAIEKRPQADKMKMLRGLIYQELSETQELRKAFNLKALDDFNKAEATIKNYELYGGRGWTLLLLKRYNDAVKDFNTALADTSSKYFFNDPSYMIPHIYMGRGIAKAKLKSYKSALLDLNKSAEMGDTIARRLATEVIAEMENK